MKKVNFKRIALLVFALVFTLSLSGCGENSKKPPAPQSQLQTQTPKTATPSQETNQTPAAAKDTLDPQALLEYDSV